MRHNDDGHLFGFGPDGINNRISCFHIYLTDGIIQNQDGRFLQKSTSKGDSLLLSSGKDYSHFPDDGLKTVGKRFYGVKEAGFFSCLYQFRFIYVFIAEGYIFPDGIGK